MTAIWAARVACVVLALALATTARASTVYFLVSERPGEIDHGDSFVLPLNDPADIAHARNLVRFGPDAGRSMVFADIVAGADTINRNILAPGTPAWSWRVSRFDNFADVGVELIDGWPSEIERDVQGWINNTGGGNVDSDGDGQPDGDATIGRVGFWGYTVTAELAGNPYHLHRIDAPAPGPGVAVPLPAALPAGAALLGLLGAARYLRRT